MLHLVEYMIVGVYDECKIPFGVMIKCSIVILKLDKVGMW